MTKQKDLVLFEPDGTETVLPYRWEICGVCEGEDFTLSHVECDGGGFTGSEWAEQDDDFREEYMKGKYSMYARSCPYCEGGKVKVAYTARMTPEQCKQWSAQQREEADYQSECEMERRYGA